MKNEVSLTCSQETGHYLEPNESSPQLHTLLL